MVSMTNHGHFHFVGNFVQALLCDNTVLATNMLSHCIEQKLKQNWKLSDSINWDFRSETFSPLGSVLPIDRQGYFYFIEDILLEYDDIYPFDNFKSCLSRRDHPLHHKACSFYDGFADKKGFGYILKHNWRDCGNHLLLKYKYKISNLKFQIK